MRLCPICSNVLPETEDVVQCPNCGAAIDAATTPRQPDAVPPPPPPVGRAPLPPASGAVPPPWGSPPPQASSTPWEDRDRLGLLPALIDTTRLVLASPSAFFRGMPVTGGIGSPLLYAVLVGWVGVIVGSFYQAVFRSFVGPGFSAYGERPELAAVVGFMQSWGGFAVQVVFGGVLVAVGVFIWSGILHLMLLLLGGGHRDFEATVRVVAYSQATSLLLLLPFCGSMLAFFWSLALYVIGLAAAHGIGHGRAAAAVLLPIVFCCCCCGALGGLAAWGMAGLAGMQR